MSRELPRDLELLALPWQLPAPIASLLYVV